ncbi:MAG TPA: hypothetical protein PK233_09015 [Candidatus Atribacteria bacterium]|nr:hypothetical protein [Candidatus Atribacteria bacterium]
MIEKEVWVLMNPDNEHWDEDYATNVVAKYSDYAGVRVEETNQTRDTGFGQERMYIVKGKEENILWFEEELNEHLY